MHRSHESGRDVDIFYYAVDGEGKPLPNPPAMIRFADGWRGGRVGSSGKPGRRMRESLPDAHLDLRRTWALVASLLSDPIMEVQLDFHPPADHGSCSCKSRNGRRPIRRWWRGHVKSFTNPRMRVRTMTTCTCACSARAQPHVWLCRQGAAALVEETLEST